MTRKFLAPLLFVLAALAVATVVSTATAGVGIADEPCPTVAGEHTNTCPPGTVGVPYSIQFREAEGSGCGPGKQTFTVDSGTFPPGLALETSGVVSGVPTQAGGFTFYVKIAEPVGEVGCQGSVGEKRFTIPINPGVPKLTLGPETAPVGTVSAAYSLQMTATVPDPKTWSIVAGTLPPGLAINASTGLISGTPQTAGSYPFTVHAAIDAQRTDTKALTIDIRNQLAIVVPELPTTPAGQPITRWEVGVPFTAPYRATGGTESYTWRLAAGALPRGLALAADGSISGRPTLPGVFRFTISVADTEGRQATAAARLIVAPRLAIVRRPLRLGILGKIYRAKLTTTGGVAPRTWRVMFGPLPRGLRLDRELGVVWGSPRRPGRYWVRLEVVDALGLKSAKNFLIRIAAPKKPAVTP